MKAEILILGVLHRGDMHPYEIKRRLKTAQVEAYLDVDVGTLYYAVKQLAKDGLIAERGQEMSGRQVRTIYGLTDSGRDRFQDLIAETMADKSEFKHPLYPALLFLHLADRDAAADIARDRLQRLTERQAVTEALYRFIEPLMATGGRLLMANALAHLKTEIEWTRMLISELEAGPLFAGDPGAFDPSAVEKHLKTLNLKGLEQ